MTKARRTRRRAELFEASLGTGIGQALAGWAAEYTHSLLESDPKLREEFRQSWRRMYKRICEIEEEAEAKERTKRTRRRSAAAPAAP
jgi:hypothetical protein